MTHTAESLIAFERRVADAFAAKQIRSPVHLCSDSQAAPMIEIFKDWRPGDWCFGTWRSHFMALLAGVPEQEVFDAILEGRSMFLQFRKYNVFCSAIVGGILPIALGVAAGIKRQRDSCKKCSGTGHVSRNVGDNMDWGCTDCPSSRVHVFIGDMCFHTGLFSEFEHYADGHCLPIRIIVENNELSTNANTRRTWGTGKDGLEFETYQYERNYPHVGLSQRVSF